jgi:hypothetical protein
MLRPTPIPAVSASKRLSQSPVTSCARTGMELCAPLPGGAVVSGRFYTTRGAHRPQPEAALSWRASTVRALGLFVCSIRHAANRPFFCPNGRVITAHKSCAEISHAV